MRCALRGKPHISSLVAVDCQSACVCAHVHSLHAASCNGCRSVSDVAVPVGLWRLHAMKPQATRCHVCDITHTTSLPCTPGQTAPVTSREAIRQGKALCSTYTPYSQQAKTICSDTAMGAAQGRQRLLDLAYLAS